MSRNTQSLSDQYVLITGAGRRVGAVIARRLASSGARVLIHANSSLREATDLAQTIQNEGGQAEVIGADLATDHGIRTLCEAIGPNGPYQVNALIQSASLYFPTPLIDLDPTTLDAYYYVHLRAPHLLAKAFALRLLPADRSSRDQPKHSSGQKPLGRIIHITDASLNRPYAHHTAYLATKGALDALTRALAWDLAPYITVNNVAPGTVLPPPDVSPEYLRILEKKSPLGRVGSPEDVARAVQFLLEDPGFVTGSTITVDGGACMG